MRTFLLWRPRAGERDADSDPHRIAAKLQSILAPLFQTAPRLTVRQTSGINFVLLSLPIVGWIPGFSEEDDHGWVTAIDYPIDAAATLRGRGLSTQPGPLLALARALDENGRPLLSDLSPPFSLVWHDRRRDETHVQNDGLGQAQLLEYDDGRTWALTNRTAALGALDISLEPVAERWAARMVLGWFPLNTTGFKHLEQLAPATHLRVDARGTVTRTHEDVVSAWVHPPRIPLDDGLEMARDSLLRYIRAASPLWEHATVGLSGGYDSRAVVSSLRKAGVGFAAYVKGNTESRDVAIASRLAAIAGLELTIDRDSELPSPDPIDLKRSIGLSLLWQGGLLDTGKHKTFFAAGRRLAPGGVRLMGQHGEIGRRFFHPRNARITKMMASPAGARIDFSPLLIDEVMQTAPPYLRPDMRQRAHDLIAQALRQAAPHRLSTAAALDFFYLYERTRRLNAGSLSSQTNQVVTPFLNPDYIRAVFASTQHDRDAEAFHRFIVEMNAPDWAQVPYESHNSPYYDSLDYWRSVGTPLVEQLLARDGFWLEVCDRDRARDEWIQAPDELAILCLTDVTRT